MTAQTQEGLFTTQQAAEASFSPQLLVHHVQAGRVTSSATRDLSHCALPRWHQEDLVAAWLRTDGTGVVSQQTALALHGLSDTLPSQIHLTLPTEWRRRRFRVPTDVVLHHADIPARDRTWVCAVPATNPRRTVND